VGYTTFFKGALKLSPTLTKEQRAALAALHEDETPIPNVSVDVSPPADTFCQWVATADGTKLEWDGEEKFYDYVEWLQYLCAVFAKWGVQASGTIRWTGEEPEDRGAITVKRNVVTTEVKSPKKKRGEED
jgi:hypothetical protein